MPVVLSVLPRTGAHATAASHATAHAHSSSLTAAGAEPGFMSFGTFGVFVQFPV